MSLLDGLFLSYETSVSDLLNPELWLENAVGGSRTQSGEVIGPYSSMSIAAYFAAIRAISEDIAKLPLGVYRSLKPRGKERVADHPLHRVIHDAPNPQQTSMGFRETMQAHVLGWGNGYARIGWDGRGQVTELRIMHPNRVTPLRMDTGEIRYKYREQGAGKPEIILGESEVLHIRGLGDDGISGYSIARVAAESLGVSLAAQTFGAAFFGNSTMPCGVLTHPGKLGDKAYQHLRESWSHQHQGGNKAAKPAILEEGIKWERMAIPPEEAQFLETRQFQIEEIARWFRMPPHKLQHLLRSNYNSIEQLAIEYVQDTLLPWCVRWEQAIAQKCLALPTERDLFVKHTVQGLLRGDQAGRSASYSTLFQIGALSQNDIRELEDMNPVDDGDTYYVPSNLTRCEDAAQGKVASAAGVVGPPVERDEEDDEDEENDKGDEGDEDSKDEGASEKEPEEKPAEGDKSADAGSIKMATTATELPAPPSPAISDPEVPPDEPPDEPPVSIATILGPVWDDVATRVVRKEAKAVARAATKYTDIPAAWHGWLDDFYGELEHDVVEMATPGALAISAANDIDREAINEALRDVARTYVVESRLLLSQADEGSQVESVMAGWVPERQEKLAASLTTRLSNV